MSCWSTAMVRQVRAMQQPSRAMFLICTADRFVWECRLVLLQHRPVVWRGAPGQAAAAEVRC